MFKLPDLPYAHDALAPTVSAETMHLHHDKHHARYFAVTNEILEKAGRSEDSLEAVIVKARKDGDRKLFNNAAQAWNHTFFWECMSPAAETPSGALAAAVDAAFGGLDGLKAKFVEEGAAHFGSGWVWLVAEGAGLKIVQTHDGENPLGQDGVVPLLVCDLWEHAYYVDYRNDRAAFLKAWFDAMPNWTFAAAQYDAAQRKAEPWTHPKAA